MSQRTKLIMVLSLVMGMSDTPAFNALLTEKGLAKPDGFASPDEVAAFGLASLVNGPMQNWSLPEAYRLGSGIGSAAERRERILMIDKERGNVFGD